MVKPARIYIEKCKTLAKHDSKTHGCKAWFVQEWDDGGVFPPSGFEMEHFSTCPKNDFINGFPLYLVPQKAQNWALVTTDG